MKFLPSLCCFCINIHQAYTSIIYIDLIRFSWMCNYLCFLFFSRSCSRIDYFVKTLVLLSNFPQTYHALKCLNFKFYQTNYLIHRAYFLSKLFFVFANITTIIMNMPQFDSHFFQKFYEDPVFYFDILLNVMDIYFLIVIYAFLIRVKKGKYELILETYETIKEAITLEINGVQIITYNDGEDFVTENGVIFFKRGEKKIKNGYFSWYPEPLFKKSSLDAEICDLTNRFKENSC